MRRVSSVQDGSLAARHQIEAGDIILSINGEPLLDEIDYQALTSRRKILLLLQKADGRQQKLSILKAVETPLGLHFDDSIIGNPRTCANKCVFCFVDQMPKGMRETLYVKDDDWRLSLMMGNFISLTNVGEREFDRILRRKVSPLYISVHATDPELRVQLMGNRNAGQLMERLNRLKDAGISFHCQLVLSPGLNDGSQLTRSLEDLYALFPHALSVAVVPVGLTSHREGLANIKPYTKDQAAEVIGICNAFSSKATSEIGTNFCFIADEFISIAQLPLPDEAYYEDFSQQENGVGMLRRFEEDLKAAYLERQGQGVEKSVLLPCGQAVAPFLEEWLKHFSPRELQYTVLPLRNLFFGETVTVSGLLVGQDLIDQLAGHDADEILIPDNMLNSDGEMFLDNISPQQVAGQLGLPIKIFRNNGAAFYQALAAPKTSLSKRDAQI